MDYVHTTECEYAYMNGYKKGYEDGYRQALKDQSTASNSQETEDNYADSTGI